MTRILAFVFVALLFHGPISADQRDPAADFSLSQLDGRQVSLSDYRGQVVLVNFWATWCPPCVNELPSMQALRDGLADQPFEILALNMGERPKEIQRFLDSFDTELSFPILLNADHSVAKNWKVRGMPTSVLVDKNGQIAMTEVGPRDWNGDALKQRILPLLVE